VGPDQLSPPQPEHRAAARSGQSEPQRRITCRSCQTSMKRYATRSRKRLQISPLPLIPTLKGQVEWTSQARAASDVRAVDERARSAATAWQQWQRGAFARVRSTVRLTSRFGLVMCSAEHARTGANACPDSTSWGHWFEPSVAGIARVRRLDPQGRTAVRRTGAATLNGLCSSCQCRVPVTGTAGPVPLRGGRP
jgi:hypothetical protein